MFKYKTSLFKRKLVRFFVKRELIREIVPLHQARNQIFYKIRPFVEGEGGESLKKATFAVKRRLSLYSCLEHDDKGKSLFFFKLIDYKL